MAAQGQFDDASDVEEAQPAALSYPALSSAFSSSLVAPHEPVDFSDSDDGTDDSDDGLDEDAMDRVYGQDWAEAGGDFTKRYNRLRQHVVVTDRTTTGTAKRDPAAASTQLLPAVNRRAPPRAAKQSTESRADGSSGPLGTHTSKLESSLAQLSSLYADRLSLGDGVTGAQSRKGGSERSKDKDKADRATNEQVLDPRTRLVLYKMIGRGLVGRIDGCVSTGKEANVYHALAGTPEGDEVVDPSAPVRHLALKIYKTSILTFKDRDRYVTGEYRFRSGYARSNPRKMVRLWAEKELRNLRRLKAAGLRCPDAIEVRSNVLVMSFLGLGETEDEWMASPRLKDADLPEQDLIELYIELLTAARTMYRRCKLVHADLSEYNVLYHDGHLVIIDVSQSVEHDHPHAFDFLRKDLENVDAFFGRRGVVTLGLQRSFDLVAALHDERPGMTTADDAAAVRAAVELGPDVEVVASDESVFARSFIPRTLTEVFDVERDAARVRGGQGADLIYANVTGIASANPASSAAAAPAPAKPSSLAQSASAVADASEATGSASGTDSASEDQDDDGSSSADENGFVDRAPRGKKFEDKEAKRQRKLAVKEDARERRTKKMPKAEKARRVKRTSGKR